jgi:hypothetical protein
MQLATLSINIKKNSFTCTPVASGPSYNKEASSRTAPTSTKDNAIDVLAVNAGVYEDDHMRPPLAAAVAPTMTVAQVAEG